MRNFDDVWEADLMDMRSIKSYNDGYSYVITVIDVISKYAWAEPMKDKTSRNVADAFARIFSKVTVGNQYVLKLIKAKNLSVTSCKKFVETWNCIQSGTESGYKSCDCRKTIKERTWRYFTHKNTRRYVDVLQKIVDAYNHTKHSATKMVPVTVTLYNAAKARENLQRRYGNRDFKALKYCVGDLVRVSRAKNVFAKGYESRWTLEIFKITRISSTTPPAVYYLEDLAGEEIAGFFYTEELCRVRTNLTTDVFEIDKILKTRVKGSSIEYFVKWKGYGDKFNSWVRANQLKNI